MRRPIEKAQHLSIRYTERLAEAGLELSVGSFGDSYERSIEVLEYATLDWVATGLPHAGDELPRGERVFLTGANATSLILGLSAPLAPPEPAE